MAVALLFAPVQTFFAQRLTSYLSGELNTKVSVERVSIRLFSSVVLKDLYVEDQHGDTLLFAEDFNVAISNISTKKHFLEIGKLTVSKARFHLRHYKADVHDNLYFLTSYFASGDTTKKGAPWVVKLNDISLRDMEFVHEVEKDTAQKRGVDFSHLAVRNINGEFRNFSTKSDTIFVDIRSLSFADRSGFVVNNFSAGTRLSSHGIDLSKLQIVTPHTNIATDLAFHFSSFASFDEFTHDVKWESDFANSKVSFSDIAYFVPDLWGLDKSLILDGHFKGSVNNFKGKNVTLSWGDQSFFKGSVSMKGLPYIDDTYMEVNAEEIKTDKHDVEWLPLPPFESKEHVIIPENLASLGKIRFKGKFTGFVSDFVAYGNVNTSLGSISSDLNFKYDKNTKAAFYSGHLSARQFDAGKIISEPDLGKVSFSVDLKGKGLRLDRLDAKLNGLFSQLEYRNYSYHNIKVDGELAKKLFNGAVSVSEPDADFDFKGSIDFRLSLPKFHFIADVRALRLDTLNLFKSSERTVIKATMRSQLEGNALDNITGGIEVEDIDFQSGNKLFHVNEISLRADKSARERTIDIQSDNLDAHFAGKFELAKLGDSFKEILPHFLPSVILPRKSFTSNQDFEYKLRLKNLNVIAETFFPAWQFAPNTLISGHYNSSRNDLMVDLATPYIRFNKFTVEMLNVRISSLGDQLSMDTRAERILQGEKNFIIQPDITAQASNNHVSYIIRLADIDTLSNRAFLKGSIDFASASRFDVRIDSSDLIVEKARWSLSNENLIHFDSSDIAISGMNFSRGVQSLSLDGNVTRRPDGRVFLRMQNFQLGNLNAFLFANSTLLNGLASGNVSVHDPFGKFQIEADLKVADFAVNNDTIGNASVNCTYDNTDKTVTAAVNVIKGTAKIIDIDGTYYTSRSDNNLDFNIKFNNLYMHPLERYVTGVMKEMFGKLTADLKLTGTFKKPLVNGMLDLRKVSLTVDYLNTHYSFSSMVAVKDNIFLINGMKVYDVNNNTAELNGKITNDYFKNFKFDVAVTANKFQALNTTVKNNSLYNGVANVSGYATFVGPIHMMTMNMSLAPEKGTTLNIPLNTTEDLTASNFITFINRTKDTSKVISRGSVDLSGVNMTINLELNRNADINIIFDEKIGDVISGNGTGSLRLEITPAGNFYMYGTYAIEKGDYLFTLKNLINKKFKIDPGGTITWAGDPYKANIDISAVYVVYTSSLYNVISVPDENLKSRLPVDLTIHLTNWLMNPTISYEINVRELTATEAGILKTILNSEQELNNQMLSLLLFNQFAPYQGGTQTASLNTAGAANVSELLSNQVSNWLGQISSDVTIGINYRAKETYSNEELKILVSKSFINDRLTIEGDVGMVGGDPNAATANSQMVGDFYANYKLSKDGRFRLKGFNRSNANNINKYAEAPYTQGFGFMYRQEFNTIADLMVKWRLRKKSNNEN